MAVLDTTPSTTTSEVEPPECPVLESVPNSDKPSSMDSDSEPIQTRLDVLYGLRLKRADEQSTHYLSQPFSGIDYGEFYDSSENHDFESSAVILEAQVFAPKKTDFANTPQNWWQQPIPPDFHKVVGSKRPVRLTLTIVSKRLRDLLFAIIDYGPPQSLRGYHEYHSDSELNFRGLLLHYDEIKRALASFIESGFVKERYQSQAQSLTAQLETFGDISSVPWGPPYGKVDPLPTIEDIQTACDVGTLLRIMTPSYKRTVIPALQDLQCPSPQIQFQHLWMIYKPGTIVYRESMGVMSAFVVVSAILHKAVPRAQVSEHRVNRYIIEAWNLRYNGQFLVRAPIVLKVEEFRAPRMLESLELIPAKWHDKADGGQTTARIKKRGDQFRHFIQQGCSHRLFKHPKSTYEGPVILDPVGYNEQTDAGSRARQDNQDAGIGRPVRYPLPKEERAPSAPRDMKGFRRFRNYTNLDARDPEQAGQITDEHLFLMEKTINGLALNTKRWMRFYVEGIREESPFSAEDQLNKVLTMENDADREVLQTIKRKSTAQSSDHFTLTPDFIPGKGEGEVFLLYGGPGTGKTLSAECVANDTKRPLLSLTMSDLEPHYDTALRRWFSLGAKWGALIIIDEADVFVSKRIDNGFNANHLTTVFLRSLEYYAGVLFLTTNRPGQMDDAFISRITVPIWYPELTKVSQRDIWDRFCRRYESYDEDLRVRVDLEAKDHVMELKEDLNGREIRKVMQNALALAQLDADRKAKNLQRRDSANTLKGSQTQTQMAHQQQAEVRIELNHFKKALKRHNQFKKYLTDLNRGRDESLRNMLQVNYLSGQITQT